MGKKLYEVHVFLYNSGREGLEEIVFHDVERIKRYTHDYTIRIDVGIETTYPAHNVHHIVKLDQQ